MIMEFNKKAGHSVHLELVVCDENGDKISDIPQGGWYGLDREQSNFMARDLISRVTQASADWEKMANGGGSGDKAPRR